MEKKDIGLLTILFVVASLASYGWYWSVGNSWPHELGALFSGLGFVALVGTLIFQGRELKESQEARKSQNDVMNKTALLQGYTTWLKYNEDQVAVYKNHIDTTLKELHADQVKEAAKRIDDLLKDLEVRIREK
ncbi:MAG TPA: hypothetical protein VK517_02515 [Cyclobacteriaceae bacterium]|nr:hypothetical protein [Cyclobacteriaceae bacterium]